jgi:hypothetical protein
VFTDTVEQAEAAVAVLRRGGAPAATVHGGLEDRQRRSRLARFGRGELVALAAPRVLDEGVDLPDADVALALSAFRTRRHLIQRLGRVLRLKADGRAAHLVLLHAAGTLEDPRVAFSQSVSTSRTLDIPEQFACPTDPGSYTNDFLSFTETNVVTLNGGIHLADTATVDIICQIPPPVRSETAWAANGNIPGSLRYTPRGNWATYLAYASAPKTVTLFAGQNQPAGTVSLSAPSGGMVTITISLNPGWSFNPNDVIHIQDYESPPSGNPAPGRFAYKFLPGATITVPVNNFYGIHMVVWTTEP